jgi:hypothetical protein
MSNHEEEDDTSEARKRENYLARRRRITANYRKRKLEIVRARERDGKRRKRAGGTATASEGLQDNDTPGNESVLNDATARVESEEGSHNARLLMHADTLADEGTGIGPSLLNEAMVGLGNLRRRGNSTQEESHEGPLAFLSLQDEQEDCEGTPTTTKTTTTTAATATTPVMDASVPAMDEPAPAASVVDRDADHEADSQEEDEVNETCHIAMDEMVPAASMPEGRAMLEDDIMSERSHLPRDELTPAASVLEGRAMQKGDSSSSQWRVDVTALPFPPPPLKGRERNAEASAPTFEQVRSHLVRAFQTEKAHQHLQKLTDPKSKEPEKNLSESGEKFADRIGGMRFEVFLGASLETRHVK